MKKKWLSEQPDSCQVCGKPIRKGQKFYDFATRMGPWALGCKTCFKEYGRGLGIGNGQEYIKP